MIVPRSRSHLSIARDRPHNIAMRKPRRQVMICQPYAYLPSAVAPGAGGFLLISFFRRLTSSADHVRRDQLKLVARRELERLIAADQCSLETTWRRPRDSITTTPAARSGGDGSTRRASAVSVSWPCGQLQHPAT
jgi:hypothetical protein